MINKIFLQQNENAVHCTLFCVFEISLQNKYINILVEPIDRRFSIYSRSEREEESSTTNKTSNVVNRGIVIRSILRDCGKKCDEIIFHIFKCKKKHDH